MTDYKELIKNFTEEDYKENRVNLHIHTTYSDGRGEFSDIIKQAKNYKAIAISDHNTIQGYLENKIPNNVIPAVEFDVWCGYVFMHLLAYGIDVNSEHLKPFLAKSKRETEWDIVRIFAKRNIKKLIHAIHKAGGIAVKLLRLIDPPDVGDHQLQIGAAVLQSQLLVPQPRGALEVGDHQRVRSGALFIGAHHQFTLAQAQLPVDLFQFVAVLPFADIRG